MSVWPVSTLRALAAKHRVTIYDNRDLGHTTVTSGPFTLPDLADDAAGLIGALGLHRPAVFGWSTGGEIGLLLALRHPDVLSALAVTGATPGGPKSVLPPPKVIALFASANSDIAALFDGSQYGPAALSDAERATIALPPDGEPPLHVRGEFPPFLEPEPPSLAPAAAKYDQAEKAYWAAPEPNLHAITVRVLVMNGTDDYAVPQANARYIAMRIGHHVRLDLDPGGRHAWFVEHPDRFLLLMNNFLG